MPYFSKRSRERLATVDPALAGIFDEVVQAFDCTVLCGYRGEAEQNRAHAEGRSQLRYPESNHNSSPSWAVDVAPYPIDWEDVDRFRFFGFYVLGVAHARGVPVRWGGRWDGLPDGDPRRNGFADLVHFERRW